MLYMKPIFKLQHKKYNKRVLKWAIAKTTDLHRLQNSKNHFSSPKSLKHSLGIIKARPGNNKLIHLIIHGVKPTMFKGLEKWSL
jgi:hypothetical protein